MADNGNTPELKFDLSKIKARDIAKLQKALVTADTITAAGIYAEIIVECPKEWGAPNDPDTYLNLNYYTEFWELMSAMGEAGKNARAR